MYKNSNEINERFKDPTIKQLPLQFNDLIKEINYRSLKFKTTIFNNYVISYLENNIDINKEYIENIIVNVVEEVYNFYQYYKMYNSMTNNEKTYNKEEQVLIEEMLYEQSFMINDILNRIDTLLYVLGYEIDEYKANLIDSTTGPLADQNIGKKVNGKWDIKSCMTCFVDNMIWLFSN